MKRKKFVSVKLFPRKLFGRLFLNFSISILFRIRIGTLNHLRDNRFRSPTYSVFVIQIIQPC